MKYPVAVWFEEGTYTAEIPSLPGVVTEADNLPDLEKAIKEAASGWMEAELDSGRLVPEPDSINHFRDLKEYKDCFWMLVDIDIESLSDKTERVNISIPSRVLRRLDFLAASSGMSRSGYLARMVLCKSVSQNQTGSV